MAKHTPLLGLVILTAIAVGGFLAYGHIEGSKPAQCDICERLVHEGQAYTLVFSDGTRKRACCPRCGMRDQLAAGGRFVRALATDQFTEESFEAEKAFYVEGSDAHYCIHDAGPLREPGVVYKRSFDRCLPSLVGFKTQEEGLVFQGRHGGRLISYQDAIESVKRW